MDGVAHLHYDCRHILFGKHPSGRILAINGKPNQSWIVSLYSYYTREADGDLACRALGTDQKELGIPLLFPAGMISCSLSLTT